MSNKFEARSFSDEDIAEYARRHDFLMFGEDQVHPFGIATVSAAPSPTLTNYQLRGIGEGVYPEIVPLTVPHKTEYDPETGAGSTMIFKPETKPKK